MFQARSKGFPITSTLITGAASGIGRALALRLAAEGHILHLGDRDGPGLARVVAECRVRLADTRPRVIDVTDRAEMADWIETAGRLDMVIAGAGVQFSAIGAQPEDISQTWQTLEVNLMGVMNTALPAMEIMTRQSPDAAGLRGRIAVMSSLAAFVSVPGAAAYCASKAAIDAWAVGNAWTARRRGIQLTSLCPGYVRTPMTAINHFPMSGLMEPDEAARIILRGIAAGRVRLAFPWRMAVASRFGAMLPAGSAAWFLSRRLAGSDTGTAKKART